MMYDANKLTRVVGAIMSAVMVMGIAVLVIYTTLYDKRDPDICTKFGGVPVVVDGKPGCDIGEEL